MVPHPTAGLREIERWLTASATEAERLLPDLLAMPAAALGRELRARPELRTPGMIQCLLRVAHDALDRLPARAHELTVVVLRYVGAMAVPPGLSSVVRIVQGEAWREYANALRGIERPHRAQRALAMARSLFSSVAGSAWYLATVDLVEAPMLHDLGRHAEALTMVRRAAYQFALFRDDGNFVQARMLEVWMMRAAGESHSAAALWSETAAAAVRHGSAGMSGRLAARMGMIELRREAHGEAMLLLKLAIDLLDKAGLRDDEIVARWYFAEAAAEGGKLSEAIFEYFRVRTELLARGRLCEAAIATVAVLDLLIAAGRLEQLQAVAVTFLYEFRDAGMPITALEPFAWLRGRIEADDVARTDLESVRTYFEDLPQNPHARFVAPR